MDPFCIAKPNFVDIRGIGAGSNILNIGSLEDVMNEIYLHLSSDYPLEIRKQMKNDIKLWIYRIFLRHIRGNTSLEENEDVFNRPLAISTGGRKIIVVLTSRHEYEGKMYPNPVYEFFRKFWEKTYTGIPMQENLRVSIKSVGTPLEAEETDYHFKYGNPRGLNWLEEADREIPEKLFGKTLSQEDVQGIFGKSDPEMKSLVEKYRYIPSRWMIGSLPIEKVNQNGEVIDFTQYDPNRPNSTGLKQPYLQFYLEPSGEDIDDLIKSGFEETSLAEKMQFIISRFHWHPFFEDIFNEKKQISPEEFLRKFIKRLLYKYFFDSILENRFLSFGNGAAKNRSLQNSTFLGIQDFDDLVFDPKNSYSVSAVWRAFTDKIRMLNCIIDIDLKLIAPWITQYIDFHYLYKKLQEEADKENKVFKNILEIILTFLTPKTFADKSFCQILPILVKNGKALSVWEKIKDLITAKYVDTIGVVTLLKSFVDAGHAMEVWNKINDYITEEWMSYDYTISLLIKLVENGYAEQVCSKITTLKADDWLAFTGTIDLVGSLTQKGYAKQVWEKIEPFVTSQNINDACTKSILNILSRCGYEKQIADKIQSFDQTIPQES